MRRDAWMAFIMVPKPLFMNHKTNSETIQEKTEYERFRSPGQIITNEFFAAQLKCGSAKKSIELNLGTHFVRLKP